MIYTPKNPVSQHLRYKEGNLHRNHRYMLFCLSVSLWLFSLIPLDALTIRVALDGSQDYTNIQSAISSSSQGDSVLVYPGRYYENVDFLGKSITVCSLEGVTSDSTYISASIIDGNNSGSCVRFRNQEQGALLRGFTLEHGTGYPYGAENLLAGGGIHVYTGSSVSIINCDIRYNRSAEGAGIFVIKSSISLSGVKIHDNYAYTSVAGLYIYSVRSFIPNIVFDPINRCSVYNNFSCTPCDIVVIDVMANLEIYLDMASVPTLSSFYCLRINNFEQTQGFHDNIYSLRSYREEVNQDLYVSTSGDDNNSGLSPVAAMKSITKAVHRIASDSLNIKTVYVLPGTFCEGDDDQLFPIPGKSYVRIIGSGSETCTLYTNQTYNSTLQSVYVSSRQKFTAFSGFTISIQPDVNRRIRPIVFHDNDSELSDLSISDTNVYREGALNLLQPNNAVLKNIRIRNIVTNQSIIYGYRFNGSMTNCIFENISSTQTNPDGWAVTMFDMWAKDSLRVENCVFRNFSVPDSQPTMHMSNTNQFQEPINIKISNSLFDNIRTGGQSPVVFNNRDVDDFQVNNCTFVNNQGTVSAVGLTGKIKMKNNVFYNPDCDYEIQLYLSEPYGIDSNVYLDYNNIRGGQTSVYNPYSNNHVYYSDTNSNSDPMFANLVPGNPFYATLSGNSPCVDTGTPDITGLDLPPYDLAWNWRVWNGRIDMGCYEYGSEPWVVNDDPEIPALPEGISLLVYPNPIKASAGRGTAANIEFTLAKKPRTIPVIDIYNIRGQKVKTIQVTENNNSRIRKGGLSVDEKQTGEFYFTTWNGKGDADQTLSSGTYIIRVTADGASTLKKVTLIQEH